MSDGVGGGHTGRHAIERNAVDAHMAFLGWCRLPVYYVFDDLSVLTPLDILTVGQQGPYSRNGSGGAYYLVPASIAKPFTEVFGPPPGT